MLCGRQTISRWLRTDPSGCVRYATCKVSIAKPGHSVTRSVVPGFIVLKPSQRVLIISRHPWYKLALTEISVTDFCVGPEASLAHHLLLELSCVLDERHFRRIEKDKILRLNRNLLDRRRSDDSRVIVLLKPYIPHVDQLASFHRCSEAPESVPSSSPYRGRHRSLDQKWGCGTVPHTPCRPSAPHALVVPARGILFISYFPYISPFLY